MKTKIKLFFIHFSFFSTAIESEDYDFFDEGYRVSNVTKMDCLWNLLWEKENFAV